METKKGISVKASKEGDDLKKTMENLYQVADPLASQPGRGAFVPSDVSTWPNDAVGVWLEALQNEFNRRRRESPEVSNELEKARTQDLYRQEAEADAAREQQLHDIQQTTGDAPAPAQTKAEGSSKNSINRKAVVADATSVGPIPTQADIDRLRGLAEAARVAGNEAERQYYDNQANEVASAKQNADTGPAQTPPAPAPTAPQAVGAKPLQVAPSPAPGAPAMPLVSPSTSSFIGASSMFNSPENLTRIADLLSKSESGLPIDEVMEEIRTATGLDKAAFWAALGEMNKTAGENPFVDGGKADDKDSDEDDSDDKAGDKDDKKAPPFGKKDDKKDDKKPAKGKNPFEKKDDSDDEDESEEDEKEPADKKESKPEPKKEKAPEKDEPKEEKKSKSEAKKEKKEEKEHAKKDKEMVKLLDEMLSLGKDLLKLEKGEDEAHVSELKHAIEILENFNKEEKAESLEPSLETDMAVIEKTGPDLPPAMEGLALPLPKPSMEDDMGMKVIDLAPSPLMLNAAKDAKTSPEAQKFIHEKMRKMHKAPGKKNPKQDIAIALNMAREKGMKVPDAPAKKKAELERQAFDASALMSLAEPLLHAIKDPNAWSVFQDAANQLAGSPEAAAAASQKLSSIVSGTALATGSLAAAEAIRQGTEAVIGWLTGGSAPAETAETQDSSNVESSFKLHDRVWRKAWEEGRDKADLYAPGGHTCTYCGSPNYEESGSEHGPNFKCICDDCGQGSFPEQVYAGPRPSPYEKSMSPEAQNADAVAAQPKNVMPTQQYAAFKLHDRVWRKADFSGMGETVGDEPGRIVEFGSGKAIVDWGHEDGIPTEETLDALVLAQAAGAESGMFSLPKQSAYSEVEPMNPSFGPMGGEAEVEMVLRETSLHDILARQNKESEVAPDTITLVANGKSGNVISRLAGGQLRITVDGKEMVVWPYEVA